MHPRNRYQAPHDFAALAAIVPALADYFITTPDGRNSLDFSQPQAVRLLNQALLKRDYGLRHWDLPPGNLCPGVPGRLDYIHVIADLPGLAKRAADKITGIDIGTGASLIYPILGIGEYGWRFVATDIDPTTLKVAGAIARFNPCLTSSVILRQQHDNRCLFRRVILPDEYFHFTMCNPPFFDAPEAARQAAGKKWTKLGKTGTATFNFGGKANELWTPGGEADFLRRMIRESVTYRHQVGWFTTLVSKKGYLKIADVELAKAQIHQQKVINIGQGGKQRRILAWRFKSK